jgi:ubiquinone/menaquinone biosynthesis C-methylase UbiE
MADSRDMNALYEHAWSMHEDAAFTALDASLNPRPAAALYDYVAAVGTGKGHTVLDVGCGQGVHSCAIASKFGCRVVGVDPARANLLQARRQAMLLFVTERTHFAYGAMEAQPFAAEQFDIIWCRDMLVHVGPLEQGISECARVLKPGGRMMVFNTYMTALAHPDEMSLICNPLHVHLVNLSQPHVEATFKAAGFSILSVERVGAEFVEAIEERSGRYSRELLRISRMTREEARFRQLLGDFQYEAALALYRWGIYILLGKLCPTVHILQKP